MGGYLLRRFLREVLRFQERRGLRWNQHQLRFHRPLKNSSYSRLLCGAPHIRRLRYKRSLPDYAVGSSTFSSSSSAIAPTGSGSTTGSGSAIGGAGATTGDSATTSYLSSKS